MSDPLVPIVAGREGVVLRARTRESEIAMAAAAAAAAERANGGEEDAKSRKSSVTVYFRTSERESVSRGGGEGGSRRNRWWFFRELANRRVSLGVVQRRSRGVEKEAPLVELGCVCADGLFL
jgi:hypothetical protein